MPIIGPIRFVTHTIVYEIIARFHQQTRPFFLEVSQIVILFRSYHGIEFKRFRHQYDGSLYRRKRDGRDTLGMQRVRAAAGVQATGRSQLQVNVWLRFQCPDIHQAARILDIIDGITQTAVRAVGPAGQP